MRILGVDPGLASVGWGVLEYPKGGPQDVSWGTIRTKAGEDLAQRLLYIARSLGDVITDTRPDAVVVEELFFATNVKTAIVVAQARGAILLAAAEKGVPVFEYTPLQIKKAVSGRGGASKQQVQKMVATLLGLSEVPRPDHAADALAAGLCHGHTLKQNRIVGYGRTKRSQR